MNVFKVDNYFRYILVAVSVVCIAFAARGYQIHVKPVELFLLSAAAVFAVLITVHTWSVKVWIENGILHKRTVFGRRAVEIKAVDEISVMSLRGRYIFIVVTATSFLMLSTMLGDFAALKAALKSNMDEKAFVGMADISDDQIIGKKNVMKAMLAGLLIVCAGILIYMYIKE